MNGKSFFVDLTKCTACRGCQVACKQWHKLPAEKTSNWGSYQNPADLSFITYKLVRYEEQVIRGKLDWLFFPEQCRHCTLPPCKETADDYVEGAVLQDEMTGAVLFTEKTGKMTKDQRQDVRDSCPYDIPREGSNGIMAKCDMCIDRVHNGLLPACVLTCPTGAMNFGDREEMMAMAKAALGKASKQHPDAMLVDADDVRTIYLTAVDPKKYYKYLMSDASPRTNPLFTRKDVLASLVKPFRNVMSG